MADDEELLWCLQVLPRDGHVEVDTMLDDLWLRRRKDGVPGKQSLLNAACAFSPRDQDMSFYALRAAHRTITMHIKYYGTGVTDDLVRDSSRAQFVRRVSIRFWEPRGQADPRRLDTSMSTEQLRDMVCKDASWPKMIRRIFALMYLPSVRQLALEPNDL